MNDTGFKTVKGRRSRKLWRSQLTGRFFWRLPRIQQFATIIGCRLIGHDWGQWRIETEEWFEYVDGPRPWSWRMCRRCHLPERAIPDDAAGVG